MNSGAPSSTKVALLLENQLKHQRLAAEQHKLLLQQRLLLQKLQQQVIRPVDIRPQPPIASAPRQVIRVKPVPIRTQPPAATAPRNTPRTEIRREKVNEEVKFLDRNAPPNRAEVAWWSVHGANNRCLRCKKMVRRNCYARAAHYKQRHYLEFFTLRRNTGMKSALDIWLCKQFGEKSNETRICRLCNEATRYFKSRSDLLKHINSAHPQGFSSLRVRYSAQLQRSGGLVEDVNCHKMLI